MAPLGLGLSITGATEGDSSVAVVIEDYFWKVVSGELTPLETGAVRDFHDTWELDGTDYMPRTTTTVGDEGYWALDGTDIEPLSV
jgi:hypothetical protein